MDESPLITVTVSVQRGDTTLIRHTALAAASLDYVADLPILLHDDEFGSEVWRGYTLTNHTSRAEKRPV